MTTAAQRQPFNIRLSIQKMIAALVETPNTTPNGRAYAASWIDYDDDDFRNFGHDHWARVEIIESGAGSYTRSMLQVSCFSRIKGDRFGLELERMIDLFQAAFRTTAGMIDLYDFTTSQSSPTLIANKRIHVVNGDGRWGEPEGGAANVEPPEDSRGKALTYLFRIVPDDLPSFPYRDPS